LTGLRGADGLLRHFFSLHVEVLISSSPKTTRLSPISYPRMMGKAGGSIGLVPGVIRQAIRIRTRVSAVPN
jgi:hypothetical protein